jgi:hypothetical protein
MRFKFFFFSTCVVTKEQFAFKFLQADEYRVVRDAERQYIFLMKFVSYVPLTPALMRFPH